METAPLPSPYQRFHYYILSSDSADNNGPKPMPTGGNGDDYSSVSRPSLGFPLGTALLLLVIFTLSGVFSCCYHWEKFRSVRGDDDRDGEGTDAEGEGDLEQGGGGGGGRKARGSSKMRRELAMQSVPVIMAGDQIPTFIALPCPSRPPRPYPNNPESGLLGPSNKDGHLINSPAEKPLGTTPNHHTAAEEEGEIRAEPQSNEAASPNDHHITTTSAAGEESSAEPHSNEATSLNRPHNTSAANNEESGAERDGTVLPISGRR